MQDLRSMRQCIYCHNFCRFSCPSYLATKDQKILQNQKNYLVYLSKEKKIKLDGCFGKSVYLCNDCKRCETFCWVDGKDVVSLNRHAREFAVNRKIAPEAILRINSRLSKNSSILSGKDLAKTKISLEDQAKISCKNKDKDYDIYIYLGDYTRSFGLESFYSFIKILDILKIKYVFDPEEISDGTLARDLGMYKTADSLMKENHANISRFSFKRIVVMDPESYYGFTNEYERKGYHFKAGMIHYTEYLNEFTEKIKVKRNPYRIRYFDPCKLGRGMGVYEAPRNILKSLFGLENIEFFNNKENANCCGGFISLFDNKISDDIARGLVNECTEDGCDIIVTSCALCQRNLKSVSSGTGIEIYDLSQLLEMNIEK